MQFAMGVQKVGAINNRFQVYKNPYMTENTILMGYRGSQFLETGAVYSPYIPLNHDSISIRSRQLYSKKRCDDSLC